jgi:hypothetical protein
MPLKSATIPMPLNLIFFCSDAPPFEQIKPYNLNLWALFSSWQPSQ